MTSPTHAVSGWRDGWYVVPWDVTFRDLDAIGHVNNAVYFTYFEAARTKYWLELIGGRRAHDIGFIVGRAECDFLAQISIEPIEVRVRIGEMRTTSFDFVHEIVKTRGGQLSARGKVVAVRFDWASQSKLPIDDELREKIRRFQMEE